MLLMKAEQYSFSYRPHGDYNDHGVVFSPQGSMVEALI